jgi:putative addiction module CopG family antidote
METTLKPELEEFVDARLAAGKYASRADALNAAVEALRQQERDEARQRELDQMIAAGLISLEEGRSVPFNEGTLEGIKSRGRARLTGEMENHRPEARK